MKTSNKNFEVTFNNQELKDLNVKIWDGNSSREYLDSINLNHYEENDLGPVYGHQWRHFNAPYTDFNEDYTGKGVDQLQYIIDQLSNPETRWDLINTSEEIWELAMKVNST